MKFNKEFRNSDITINYEDEKSYQLDERLELYTAVVASSLEKTFYESKGDRLDRIRERVKRLAKEDPVFVARLAVYAREKMFLRSLPLVLVVELAANYNGDDLVRRTARRVIQRADEITEILAYYQMANQRSGTKKLNQLSKQLQKGIADVFNRFDEYQFAKYNRSSEVKLKDALFLVHPKAKDAQQQKLFDKIASDSLKTAYTWETELSKTGQKVFNGQEEKEKVFRDKWTELIRSGKMGYMAMLRNLRNILEAQVAREDLLRVAQRIADPVQVRKSRQLPFRFLAAYRELSVLNSGSVSMMLDALNLAALASIENLKGFDASTRLLIASDTSGSMQVPLSKNSKIKYIDVGIVLSMLLKAKCAQAVTGIFGSTWKVANMPTQEVLSNVERMSKIDVGWSTHGYLVIDYLIKNRIKMDKVMIFTDMQLWNSNGWGAEVNKSIESQWKMYKKIAPEARIYLFDLAGYGNSPLNVLRPDVFLIGGWSEKIFEVLEAIDKGGSAITEIERIKL